MIPGIVASAVNIAASSGTTARWFKFRWNNNGGGVAYLPEFKITSTAGNLPPDMTSRTSPAPFVMTGNAWNPNGVYLCSNGALNSTSTFDPIGAYIIFDMGAEYTATGWTVNSGSWSGANLPRDMWLYSSNTGAFNGEEILIGTAFSQTFPSTNLFKSFLVFG